MLEAAIVLEIVLGKYIEAGVIAALLAFNAALGFLQEGRAQATLAALKSRLALNASVRRNNAWATVPAAGLVPGDIVKLSLGAVVAADVRLTEGEILLDQSMLTGESVPIEAGRRIRNLRRSTGAARRSCCGGDGHRNAHKVRTHGGTGSHGARRKFPAKGRSARGAQSRHLQWRHHRDPGGICPRSQDAGGRDHSTGAHGGSGVDPRSAARHLYSCGGARRAGSGTIWASFRPGSPQSTKRQASTCCARTRPAR